ncbi:MAG: hypothetical protein SGARI_006898, partial [Bacillariaceae sp.]
MGRKSKQPGGHNPLTYHERKEYARGEYGTTTARLGSHSQYQFGNCGLSLHVAKEQSVATPSGFIYERPAILEYLLTKTQELKKQQHEFERYEQLQDDAHANKDDRKRKADIEKFENAQKVVAAKKQKTQANPLQRTSYWLAESQPQAVNVPVRKSGNGDDDADKISTALVLAPTKKAPPKRPPSPNSNMPLRRKDLIPLHLKRNSDDQVVCAVSDKSISTQQALALITVKDSRSDKATKYPAQVVLEKVYNDLGAEPVCPVTGRKIVKLLQLQKGGSS